MLRQWTLLLLWSVSSTYSGRIFQLFIIKRLKKIGYREPCFTRLSGSSEVSCKAKAHSFWTVRSAFREVICSLRSRGSGKLPCVLGDFSCVLSFMVFGTLSEAASEVRMEYTSSQKRLCEENSQISFYKKLYISWSVCLFQQVQEDHILRQYNTPTWLQWLMPKFLPC